jgi:phage-related protein
MRQGAQQRPVTHEDIQERLESGQMRFEHVEQVLAKVEKALTEVIKGQEEFRSTIKPISEDIAEIKDMVGAWKAIATAGRFAKWLGVIAASIAAIIVLMKTGAHAIVEWGK